MTLTRHGRCLCGAIRYTIRANPKALVICHCTHCQRQAGSLFSANLLVDKADFVLQGQVRSYEDTGDSGQPVLRHFCPTCGSPIHTLAASRPEFVIVKAGTLDEPLAMTPDLEVYTATAAPWLPALAPHRFAQART